MGCSRRELGLKMFQNVNVTEMRDLFVFIMALPQQSPDPSVYFVCLIMMSLTLVIPEYLQHIIPFVVSLNFTPDEDKSADVKDS